MDRSRIPQGYTPLLNIYETQKAGIPFRINPAQRA